MALSVRSPQAMAIRMFEVPFRPCSRMEQVAEPRNDRAMRFTSPEQRSEMSAIVHLCQGAWSWAGSPKSLTACDTSRASTLPC
jgi:hypothetical protein